MKSCLGKTLCITQYCLGKKKKGVNELESAMQCVGSVHF